MDIVFSSLKETQLLLIVCDTEARAQLHEYLDRRKGRGRFQRRKEALARCVIEQIKQKALI